jgi:hypothetical protein
MKFTGFYIGFVVNPIKCIQAHPITFSQFLIQISFYFNLKNQISVEKHKFFDKYFHR